MKKRTRILAWLHILWPVLLALAIFVAFAVPKIIGPAVTDTSARPAVLPLPGILGGVLLLYAVVLTALNFLNMLPWIFLLMKRRWAWWYLTIIYGLETLSVVGCWTPVPKIGSHEFNMALVGSVLGLLVFGATFLILVTDPPKQRKTPTRRRRRTSRRRYTRRRPYTYDY